MNHMDQISPSLQSPAPQIGGVLEENDVSSTSSSSCSVSNSENIDEEYVTDDDCDEGGDWLKAVSKLKITSSIIAGDSSNEEEVPAEKKCSSISATKENLHVVQPLTPPFPSQNRHTMPLHLSDQPNKQGRRSVDSHTLKPQHVSPEISQITPSIATSMAYQHAQFAHACIQLLDEQDRQEEERKRNVRSALWSYSLNRSSRISSYGDYTDEELKESGFFSDDDEEDGCESIPLLTLIKAGPLYKLHKRGSTVTRKVSGKVRRGIDDSRRTRMRDRMTTKFKPKYVEVRKGMLSFYDDAPTSLRSGLTAVSRIENSEIGDGAGGNPAPRAGLVRKNIPLQAPWVTCHAIDSIYGTQGRESTIDLASSMSSIGTTFTNKSHDQNEKKEQCYFPLELIVDSGETLIRHVFATESEAGRQVWVDAINRGRVGANETDANVSAKTNLKSHSQDSVQIQNFLSISNISQKTSSFDSYAQNLINLFGKSICVPMTFVSECSKGIEIPSPKSSQNGVNTFWQNLHKCSSVINGKLFRGNDIYGAERIFGALARSILEYDRQGREGVASNASRPPITEIQAARYSRDILSSISKSDEKLEMLRLAVKLLCANDLVTIDDSNVKPNQRATLWKTTASTYSDTGGLDSEQQSSTPNDKREWIHTRFKSSRPATPYYCVLSVGVLCLYEHELPKPHTMKGSIVLVGSKIGVWKRDSLGFRGESICEEDEQFSQSSGGDGSSYLRNPSYIIFVIGKENGKPTELQLCFNDESTFEQWRDALMAAVESCTKLPTFRQSSFDEDTPISESLQHNKPSFAVNQGKGGISWYTFQSKEFNNRDESLTVRKTPKMNPFSRSVRGILKRNKTSDGDISSVGSSDFEADTYARRDSLHLPKHLPRLTRNMTDSSLNLITSSTVSKAGRAVRAAIPSKLLHISSRGDIVDVASSNDDLLDPYVESAGDDFDQEDKPSVKIELIFTSFHRVLRKMDPAEKKNALISIRATFILHFLLSGGKRGRAVKAVESIKLEALKGSVGPSSFEFVFDTKAVPRRMSF